MKTRLHAFDFIHRVASLGILLLFFLSSVLACGLSNSVGYAQVAPSQVASCPVFPADNIWNRPVTDLPVMKNSARYISSIGLTGHLQAYFGGSGRISGVPEGFPYVVVNNQQPRVPVSFYYANDSDPGPYPIPTNVPIENGANSSGDRHVIIIDKDTCRLYEMFNSFHQADGSWKAGSGATWDLRSDALRPNGWGAADAAGLPIFAGLVRYDEVAAGSINHALRFTVTASQAAYLWPGRAFASSSTNPNQPPMGLRLRLKASVDISSFSPQIQVILTALKTYGMFVADNGHNWVLSGAADTRWNHSELQQLNKIVGADFEAVDESSLQISPDSAQAAPFVPLASATASSTPLATSTISTPGKTTPSAASATIALVPLPTLRPDLALSPDTQELTSFDARVWMYLLFLLVTTCGLILLWIWVRIRWRRYKNARQR